MWCEAIRGHEATTTSSSLGVVATLGARSIRWHGAQELIANLNIPLTNEFLVNSQSCNGVCSTQHLSTYRAFQRSLLLLIADLVGSIGFQAIQTDCMRTTGSDMPFLRLRLTETHRTTSSTFRPSCGEEATTETALGSSEQIEKLRLLRPATASCPGLPVIETSCCSNDTVWCSSAFTSCRTIMNLYGSSPFHGRTLSLD
jgi:hypothetical protein